MHATGIALGELFGSSEAPHEERMLRGLAASRGVYEGPARRVTQPAEFDRILRCDVLAQGVIAAVTELGVPVPIVVRMEGTNVEEGKKMLRASGLSFTTADSMGEAAEKVVALAGKR